MNTWDVLILRFPFNDGTGAKARPAVLISKDDYHQRGQDGLFVLVTGNTEREAQYDLIIPSTHPEYAATGLIKPSAVRVDKIMNLQHSMVCRRLGSLGPILQAAVKTKLRAFLDL